jgi:uncharacterized membrane protein YdbT with pleckstrin-like domain
VGWIITAIVILIVAIYLKSPEPLVFLAIPAIMIIYRLVYWKQVRYEVTAEQIRYSRGIFHRHVDFLEMFRIRDFDQKQTLIMRMLGIMHIRLMTSDITHPELQLHGIPVSNIPDVLRQWIEDARIKNRVYIRG